MPAGSQVDVSEPAAAELSNGILANGKLSPPRNSQKLSANEKRRQRRKQKKAEQQVDRQTRAAPVAAPSSKEPDLEVEFEYVSAPREFLALSEPVSAAAQLATANGDAEEVAASAPSSSAPAGFVSAGAAPKLSSGAEAPTAGLGSTAGLGAGTAGLGSLPKEDPGESPGGLGLGATLGDDESPGGLGLGLGASSAQRMQGLLGFSPAQKPAVTADPYADFDAVFSKFASAEEVTGAIKPEQDEEDEAMADAEPEPEDPQAKAGGSDADSDDEDGDGQERMSKKKRKLLNRLKIAALKQLCPRPEVVEVWDVTAPDPQLLVYLKAYRNSVPVPRHWSQKRKYLQGKRGLEKPAFQLPDYIEATGIGEMRTAYQEKEDAKKLKQKQRGKMQPKMGKLGMDYQIMHDAFFKYQSKPHMSGIGDLYYEGKEFEARFKNARPGVLSEDLQKALGMTEVSPPPWLINMQRYGPPPSYPDLKVAGLSAPIPPGAQFGFQPGGWGKPPVDENGEPLYGDVFGQNAGADDDELIDKLARWGDLESEEEEEESEEEEEAESEDEAQAEDIADGFASVASGIASGYSSLPSGIETPDVLDLRKAKVTGPAGDRALYQVLEQQAANVGRGNLMGSDHTYVLPGEGKRVDQLRREGDVEVAISPEELEGLDDAAVRALYEQRLAAQRASAASQREDFSDMVAQKASQQKRKAAQVKEASAAKKQKDSFKF